MLKKFILFTLALSLFGCTQPNVVPPLEEDEEALNDVMEHYDETNDGEDDSVLYYNREWQESAPGVGEKAVVLHTTAGDIKIKLFPKEAPTLSTNFAELSASEKYTDVPFHRVIEGFMIQSGDYENGNGTGGESYLGKGLADEYSPKLRHIRGAVAAAKSSLPNSIGSQFYIAHDDIFQLDNAYSVFGQVYEGMDIVDKIATAEVEASSSGEMSQPVDPVYIESAEVITIGE